MRRFICLLILLLSVACLHAAGVQEIAGRIKYKHGPDYIYRLYLSDKHSSPYSLNHPSRFLSRRSIERRKRQQLPLDSTDLPVSPYYLRQIERLHFTIVGQSRWQNTVLVLMKDTAQVHQLEQLPFVSKSRLVWQSPDSITHTAVKSKYHEQFEEYDSITGQPYGNTFDQISTMQGQRLHDIGLLGQGMMIAVLDGGFKNANVIPAFQHIELCGVHDFVYPLSPDIFAETDHGTKVWSAMGVSKPYYYMGTAPKSAYWLLRCEDLHTEQEVEEDYWTMAAEFADSVGCDLINSSLGYNEYDYGHMTHRLWHLDGRTAFASRSASMLAAKGIILVNSAGNSGMGPWKKIGIPADATDILTVGAITADEPRHIAPFSSVGPSQDGRIKPDIVAIGAPAFLVNGRGVIQQDMGTSFSTPVVCGLVACLWQSLPHLKAADLIRLICETGNNREHPDNIYGYGIPNFWRAYMIGKLRAKSDE